MIAYLTVKTFAIAFIFCSLLEASRYFSSSPITRIKYPFLFLTWAIAVLFVILMGVFDKTLSHFDGIIYLGALTGMFLAEYVKRIFFLSNSR